MATIQDAVDAVNVKVGEVTTTLTKVDETLGKALGAINRLEGRIAVLEAQVTAGSETQPIIDALAPIGAALSTANENLTTKGAEFDIVGT